MATYDYRVIQRIRYAIESSFAVDMTSAVESNFSDFRHMPTVPDRDTLTESDGTVRQRFYQQHDVVLGPDHASLPIEAYLVPSGEALDASTSPTKTSQTELHEAILGGYQGGQGSTVAASPSPTTTAFSVASGHGSRFAEGQIISVAISGVDYPCVITDISTDALTVWPALPSAPSASAAVYNSQTVYCDEGDESSLQFLWETWRDRGNIWLLRGCQGDLSFNLQRNGLLTWSSNQRAAIYEHDDEITTPQGGGALAAATYDGSGPIWGFEGGFHFGPSASSTRTLIRAVEFSLTPGVSWQAAEDYAGTEGIGEWERNVPVDGITAELTILKNAGDGTYELYHDAFKAGTYYGGLWWVGAAAGSGLAIAVPTCQIMSAPESAEWNGMEAIKLSLLVKESSLTGAVATTLQRSPFVAAQF